MTVSPLSLPQEEALRFFRAKIPEGIFDHRDLMGEAHATYWTVAKAMELDVLDAIRSAADAAMAEGQTVGAFTKALTPTLVDKGWWGRQIRTDPHDGEAKLVQLGSARRLAVIYDTNMRSSYAAGRWERIQARKAARPWLRYVAIKDARTRPAHWNWHGTILPVDHPWWRTHYPPCGWFCRCSVQQLSDADLARLGLIPSAKAPDLDLQDWHNPRTGVTLKVPAGIDPGFGYNAGMAGEAAARARLMEKLEASEPPAARALIDVGMRGEQFADFVRLGVNRTGSWPVGLAGPGVQEVAGTKAAVLRLSRDTADKQARHHPELSASDYAAIQSLLDSGTLLPSKKALHWGVLGQHEGRWYELVFKTTRDHRETYVVSLHFSDAESARRIIKRGYAAVSAEGGGREGSVPVG